MEKNMQFKNITVANNTVVAVDIDNLPNWRSNAICSKKNISQIFCNDGYWISVQDIIRAEAGEHETPICVEDISCFYNSTMKILSLELKGLWTYNQLSCLLTIFNVSGEARCFSSKQSDTENVLQITINLEKDVVQQ